MKRRSFRLIGADGTLDIEIQRIDGGSLEVHEMDKTGRALHPSVIVHEWDAARDQAAKLVATAIREGRV